MSRRLYAERASLLRSVDWTQNLSPLANKRANVSSTRSD